MYYWIGIKPQEIGRWFVIIPLSISFCQSIHLFIFSLLPLSYYLFSSSLVIGVVKAYTTRVGEGPFPTEDKGTAGIILTTC